MHCGASMRRSTSSTSSAARRAFAHSLIRAFFAERAGSGDPNAAPIFIVGLPRSGSTLVEQILASHSRVEGTMELPNIINMTHQFDDMVASRDGYPETVGTAPPALLTALGSRYHRGNRAAAHRT